MTRNALVRLINRMYELTGETLDFFANIVSSAYGEKGRSSAFEKKSYKNRKKNLTKGSRKYAGQKHSWKQIISCRFSAMTKIRRKRYDT